MNLHILKQLNIPSVPGCYRFFDKNKKIIYIGKASNLRNRVISYWQKSTQHSPAKNTMLGLIKSVDWMATESEIEALLLESNLIKKHHPPFNVLLRDDKRFAYIKISTEEKWPRIFITRTIDKTGKYFGPFTSTEAVRETLRVIRKIWPFRSCRQMPKRVCLYYRIGKCAGVCEEKVAQKEYKKIIEQVIFFLEGKRTKLITNYIKEIGNWKLEIGNLKPGSKKYDEIKNKIIKNEYLVKHISYVVGSAKIIGVSEKYANDVVELAKTLNLPNVPNRIEGYDISNIYGQDAVGSMVVFSEGESNKSEYRKFKIKIGQGLANDTGMLKEILERRFNNDWPHPDLIIIDGGKGQVNAGVKILKKFKLNIVLIGISKGEGMRSANAPDKLFFAGEKQPLQLPIASPALHLFKRVRDEAHRFAIGYHKKLRSSRLFMHGIQKRTLP